MKPWKYRTRLNRNARRRTARARAKQLRDAERVARALRYNDGSFTVADIREIVSDYMEVN